MRLQLLLILLFVAAVLARARDKRDIGEDIANITSKIARGLMRLPSTVMNDSVKMFVKIMEYIIDVAAELISPFLQPFDKTLHLFVEPFKCMLSAVRSIL